jgi:hypothetical protein
MRLASVFLFTLAAFPLAAPQAAAQGGSSAPKDEIERLYAAIDSTAGLSTEERLRRKYEVYLASVDAGTAYLDALEELSESAKLAREAGILLEAGYPGLEKLNTVLATFHKKVSGALDQKSVKAFGATAGTLDKAMNAAALVDEINALAGDTNLPPSAKRSLAALRGTAEVMARLGGKLPLVGAPVEIYGEMLREMTGAVRKAAADITSLKGDGFSLTEEKEVLEGLRADRSYVRTGLYKLGLPVVMDLATTPDDAQQPAFLRTATGWREVEYAELSRLVAEYRVLNQDWLGAPRNPTPEEIVALLDDPTTRERLADRARWKVQNAIAEDFLAETGLSGISPDKARFAREDLLERLRELGIALPPGGAGFRRLLEDELREPGSSEAVLRRIVLRANPMLADYLARLKGVDPQAASLDDIAAQLKEMRRDPRAVARALAAASPATAEEVLNTLCQCIMQDQMDYNVRPAVKRQCPQGYSTNKVEVSARYDREKGACVGRFVRLFQCSPWDTEYKNAFDWSTTRMENPPRKKQPPPEGCCTIFYKGKCWRDTEAAR